MPRVIASFSAIREEGIARDHERSAHRIARCLVLRVRCLTSAPVEIVFKLLSLQCDSRFASGVGSSRVGMVKFMPRPARICGRTRVAQRAERTRTREGAREKGAITSAVSKKSKEFLLSRLEDWIRS